MVTCDILLEHLYRIRLLQSTIGSTVFFCTAHIHCINSGGGKRDAPNNGFMMIPEKAAPVTETTLRATCSVPADSR